jgi:hypothetical protein
MKSRSGDTVRKNLKESKELGKQMNRSGDAVVRHLKRAASKLRQSAPADAR